MVRGLLTSHVAWFLTTCSLLRVTSASPGLSREWSCVINRRLIVFGLPREYPRCTSHAMCRTDGDCVSPGFRCRCDSDCGMVCVCPPSISNPPRSVSFFGVTGTMCAGYIRCHGAVDCQHLAAESGLAYECHCHHTCGSICRAIPLTQPALSRPGMCPPTKVVPAFDFCSRMNRCQIDAHCVDQDKKCCLTICEKRCTTPVMPETMSPSMSLVGSEGSSSFSEPLSSIGTLSSDESGEMSLPLGDNATEAVTQLSTMNETITVLPTDDDLATNFNDNESISTGVYNLFIESPSTSRSQKDPCIPQNGSTHCRLLPRRPVCASDGITYANECFLRKAGRRAAPEVIIALVHAGPCRKAESYEGDSKRAMTMRRVLPQANIQSPFQELKQVLKYNRRQREDNTNT